MSNKNGIYRYMDCSTGHITYLANDALKNGDKKLDNLIFDLSDYGFWIHVPSDASTLEDLLSSADIPECIKMVIKKAFNLGAYWVKLDADGFTHHDLPTYVW